MKVLREKESLAVSLANLPLQMKPDELGQILATLIALLVRMARSLPRCISLQTFLLIITGPGQ